MKTASRNIRIVAMALCMAFALCAFAGVANAVDTGTDKKCSLTVKLGADAMAKVDEDKAENLTITASLYKVADFVGDGTYTYTPSEKFNGIENLANYRDFDTTGLENAAKAAAELVANAAPALEPAQTASFTAKDNTGTFTGVACGLYLLATTAEDATGTYTYTFSPILLSLPSMSKTDSIDVYDNTLELKCQRENATTGLIIKKDLARFSTLQGPATFIFQVEAEKDGKSVYSNVISMVFTAAGSQQVTIPNLPIGAKVTVTEVYGGGSYTVQGEAVQIVEKLEPSDPLTMVTFHNDYNDHGHDSHSVTNRFTPSKEGDNIVWTLGQFADVTPDVQ